ncbi:MAG TPA: 3-dehydroquinate synthase, partial [Actinobacteria bacterium]|nr:3-dehydroquinate synthase [Actinomycetota bacterium]
MSELDFTVDSQVGPYEVRFTDDALADLVSGPGRVVVLDQRVLELYRDAGALSLDAATTVAVEAREDSKSLERVPEIIEKLVAVGVRRSGELVAVGGGITQDIVAFIASILFRGMDWSFVPTTLLAQSDSCIGSKRSINAAGTKNLVGTFRAP